jgi:chorismate-pyruvate lyase
MTAITRAALLLALAGTLAPVSAREPAALVWQDDFQSRLEVYALMQSLSVDILGSASATRSLEAWCRAHRLAAVPTIIAQRLAAEDKPILPEQVQRLQVDGPAQVKYRKVRLFCGDQLLSEADNWYVPGRLTEDMNRLLETTETPFGKVIAPLQPSRQTLTVKLLWSPLPEAWEQEIPARIGRNKTHALDIPEALFEH